VTAHRIARVGAAVAGGLSVGLWTWLLTAAAKGGPR